jgi:hypothetical protein
MKINLFVSVLRYNIWKYNLFRVYSNKNFNIMRNFVIFTEG